jgi:hypothetical protein
VAAAGLCLDKLEQRNEFCRLLAKPTTQKVVIAGLTARSLEMATLVKSEHPDKDVVLLAPDQIDQPIHRVLSPQLSSFLVH